MVSTFKYMIENRELYSNTLAQTKRGTERCLAFLDAATQLFSQKGYDAVSLDDIVQHAGGSKSSLYKFFGNKEGLFTAICDYRCDIFIKDLYTHSIHESNDIKQFLTVLLRNFYQHIITPDNSKFIRMILERTKHDTKLARHLYEQGSQKMLQDITIKLELAHKAKIITCPHPRYSAKFFLGGIWHYEWRTLMNIPILDSEKEIEYYIEYTVNCFLKALDYR